MLDGTTRLSRIESPAPGANLGQGRHAVGGWVWPGPGDILVDVRARVGNRTFAGVLGLPRPDLAATLNAGAKPVLAGFTVVVELPPGLVEVALEVLGIDGRWSVAQTANYRVVPAHPPADFPVPGGALRWIDYCHGLGRLLREAGRLPDRPLPAAAMTVVDEVPYPRDLRHAPAPLIGFVDEPASVTCCRFGRIPAFGHLFHPVLRTRRIWSTVDLQAWQPLAHHQPSPGPAAHYFQYPNARDCGFVGFVDVPAQLPNPISLRIYAELEDDSLHLCQVVRARVHPLEEEKLPYRIWAPGSFDAVLNAWDQALATRGVSVERNSELDRGLAALHDDYEQLAPRRAAPPHANPPAPPATRGARLPRRVLLATHGLGLQGAPRFLLEYGRYLAAQGVPVEVVSAEDGPLRGDFTALGAKVTIIDVGELLRADTAAKVDAALARLKGLIDWKAPELVVANSFTTFWAVHAAKAAGRPVLWYVHESTTPAAFYGAQVPARVLGLVADAFGLADAVSFTTESTRRYHLAYGRPERHRITPGWIDLAATDRWLAGHPRAVLRGALGLAPGELLVCNIGTVSDRKGQHTFARAVDLLWRRHPALAARTRFILLGGRDSPFDALLREALAALGRANLVIHPETPDYLGYYAAADVFACSSYEESSPKVVLEAMACRAPIIASAVHGIPELVRSEREALLCPAGDTLAWCEGLARLLGSPRLRQQVATQARARAESDFSADAVLARHAALAGAVAAGIA